MAETNQTNGSTDMPDDKAAILELPLEQRDDIIVCENVHKWFGDFCAVRPKSLADDLDQDRPAWKRRHRRAALVARFQLESGALPLQLLLLSLQLADDHAGAGHRATALVPD